MDQGSEEEDPCHLAGEGSATHRVPSGQARHIGSVGREFGDVATNKAFGGPVAHLSGRFEQAHIRTPSRNSKFNLVELMISVGDSNLEYLRSLRPSQV